MNKKVVMVILVVTIAMVGGVVFLVQSKGPGKDYTAFAQCLAEKKITMYGAYWCPHCQREKKAFGEAFKYVPYVECTREVKRCQEEKIEGYPTWIWPEGKRLEGEQGLEKMANESRCPL